MADCVQIFKLIVQNTRICRDVLRYINKNIDAIINAGLRVKIELIKKSEFDEETIEIFRKRGITRLPALIAPTGPKVVGIKQIIDVFERVINVKTVAARASPVVDCGDPLSNYYAANLFDTDENGRKVARQDDDDGIDGQKNDIERKMAMYRRGEPKHRQAEERNITPQARKREYDRNDNIDDYDPTSEYTDVPIEMPRPSSPNGADDEMDNRILAALLNNI